MVGDWQAIEVKPKARRRTRGLCFDLMRRNVAQVITWRRKWEDVYWLPLPGC